MVFEDFKIFKASLELFRCQRFESLQVPGSRVRGNKGWLHGLSGFRIESQSLSSTPTVDLTQVNTAQCQCTQINVHRYQEQGSGL